MMEVIDKDLGWKDIVKKSRQLNGKVVKAGVLEGAGSYKNGVSVAEVATYNHYGSIPKFSKFGPSTSRKSSAFWRNRASRSSNTSLSGTSAM